MPLFHPSYPDRWHALTFGTTLYVSLPYAAHVTAAQRSASPNVKSKFGHLELRASGKVVPESASKEHRRPPVFQFQNVLNQRDGSLDCRLGGQIECSSLG